MSVTDREKQIADAEEMLGERLAHQEFAKHLYFGRYVAPALPAYPDLTASAEVNEAVADLQQFCREKIDPVKIDREARIPDDVVAGLGQLGVLGACLPKEAGGRGFSQLAYCRLVEVLGGHCGSTALFVNAHHSIGPRAIVLFGTPEQQKKWLPKSASGEWLSAFALTEPEAGSDASNVQTTATPTPDGRGFVLDGQKRWITNGGIAKVLTVMARTPVPGKKKETKITAFIVTPDMQGFKVLEERMDKVGVRGSATGRLQFENLYVPRENILGEEGKGLRVALTVLDYGRTTFGASCTGAAKFCLAKAIEHANHRVQFGQTLGSFELVKDKLAYMAAGALAMEACTYQTAHLIDSGAEEYMLETAMLKVFATDVLWRIINDTIQIYGGKAYFTDEPFERMLRDARINTIGEGANDVLKVFIAMVGLRDVGLELKRVVDSLSNPFTGLGKIGGFAGRKLGALLSSPVVVVRSTELEEDALRLGRLIGTFGGQVEKLLRRYQEEVLDRQYQLARVADAATELYVSSCVLARIDRILRDPKFDPDHHSAAHATSGHDEPHGGHAGNGHDDHHAAHAAPTAAASTSPKHDTRIRELELSRYYLRSAERRIRQRLAELWDNDDADTTKVANRLLRGQ
ncbi:MAG: acyl-CoA dehydrogenase family protein [Pirellulales bacterium]|nr:acyl-CoA dehydrogenase family protein [Pirellulales bacterium]